MIFRSINVKCGAFPRNPAAEARGIPAISGALGIAKGAMDLNSKNHKERKNILWSDSVIKSLIQMISTKSFEERMMDYDFSSLISAPFFILQSHFVKRLPIAKRYVAALPGLRSTPPDVAV